MKLQGYHTTAYYCAHGIHCLSLGIGRVHQVLDFVLYTVEGIFCSAAFHSHFITCILSVSVSFLWNQGGDYQPLSVFKHGRKFTMTMEVIVAQLHDYQ